ICRRVEHNARGFLALHLDGSDELGRLGVNNLDRTIFTSFIPGPHRDVIQSFGGVKGRVIWVPSWSIFATCQLDRLGDLKRSSVQGYNRVVSKIHPEFVRIGVKEWLARISGHCGLMDHLAG